MTKIPIEIKRQLGYIIHKTRLYYYEKDKGKNESNPYTKDNFSKDICHYHTLTKLETDYINDDEIYNLLLNKFGYSFTVLYEEHIENMQIINNCIYKVFQAVEYIDDNLYNNIKKKINNLNFANDCIAMLHVNLIELMYKFQLLQKFDEEEIIKLEYYSDLYEGLNKGLYNNIIGIYYLNKIEIDKAEKYFYEAKAIYEIFNLSKGIINTFIIAIYLLKNDYLNMINLCFEMEKYYIKSNNNKRLFHVYNYLSDYYLIINSRNQAMDYHKKRISILKNEPSLERFRFVTEYNMGIYLLENYEFDEAMKSLHSALKHCSIPQNKLKIVNVLLFLYTKNKKADNKTLHLIDDNEKHLDDAFEIDRVIFKYFKLKSEKNPYYRKYAIKKVVPLLKSIPSRIDYLLLLYQDLYD